MQKVKGWSGGNSFLAVGKTKVASSPPPERNILLLPLVAMLDLLNVAYQLIVAVT